MRQRLNIISKNSHFILWRYNVFQLYSASYSESSEDYYSCTILLSAGCKQRNRNMIIKAKRPGVVGSLLSVEVADTKKVTPTPAAKVQTGNIIPDRSIHRTGDVILRGYALFGRTRCFLAILILLPPIMYFHLRG